MKIILVITDSKRKNILYITEDLKAHTLEEAIEFVQQGKIEGVHIVETEIGTYLRSDPNTTVEDNLDSMSITINQLLEGLTDLGYLVSHPQLAAYEKIRQANMTMGKEGAIGVDGTPRKTQQEVVQHLQKYKSLIEDAAQRQGIDKYMLGAILADEYLRMGPGDWFDWLALLEVDTSIGVAQIKIETARDLIREGLYHPNPVDNDLSPENINTVAKDRFYKYLKEPVHSINFSAARIKHLIKYWENDFDLSNRTDLIGTLYSIADETKPPHDTPKPNDRGQQVKNEFYPLATEAFN